MDDSEKRTSEDIDFLDRNRTTGCSHDHDSKQGCKQSGENRVALGL